MRFREVREMGETITFEEFFEDAREGGVVLTTRRGTVYLRPTSYKGFMMQPTQPQVVRYSMHDPRWADDDYVPGSRFGSSGCLVTSVAIDLSAAGYTDDPPTVAAKLHDAGCFGGAEGNELVRLERIPSLYPKMTYEGRYDWDDTKADMATVWEVLEEGPAILKVDFNPATPRVDRHFVYAEGWDEGAGDDIWIVDPWDGARVQLLGRYALVWYHTRTGSKPTLERAICGLRILRPRDGNP
jgi:hypothetical protein